MLSQSTIEKKEPLQCKPCWKEPKVYRRQARWRKKTNCAISAFVSIFASPYFLSFLNYLFKNKSNTSNNQSPYTKKSAYSLTLSLSSSKHLSWTSKQLIKAKYPILSYFSLSHPMHQSWICNLLNTDYRALFSWIVCLFQAIWRISTL